MKRILVLNYEFPPLGGGASPVSYELAKRLSETGDFDIDVVTMGYGDLPAYEELNPRLRVHRVKCLRSKKEICYPWEQATYLVSAYFKCRELIKRNHYDVAHCHFIIPTGVLALALKKQYGLPYVITSHGSDIPGYNPDRFTLLHKFTGPLLRMVARNAKTIISPSNYLRDLIVKNISSDLSATATTIPNGTDTDKFTPQTKKKMIFSSGRLLARKGFQHIIQAVSDEDIGYEVHIAGDGPMMTELQNLAAQSKTKIVFHGWLDNNGIEYKNLLEQSAIFILASSAESFGMVLVEAMSGGCAIIATDNSGCVDTVGNAGLLFKSGDKADLKVKISTLVNSENVMRDMQQQSRSRVIEEYDWRHIISKYRANLIS